MLCSADLGIDAPVASGRRSARLGPTARRSQRQRSHKRNYAAMDNPSELSEEPTPDPEPSSDDEYGIKDYRIERPSRMRPKRKQEADSVGFCLFDSLL